VGIELILNKYITHDIFNNQRTEEFSADQLKIKVSDFEMISLGTVTCTESQWAR
jgi:hypothetical protein